MSDIAERVKKIVIDHLGVDAERSARRSLSMTFGATRSTPSNWSWHSKKNSVSKSRTTLQIRSSPSATPSKFIEKPRPDLLA